jgi:hypothetical protein
MLISMIIIITLTIMRIITLTIMLIITITIIRIKRITVILILIDDKCKKPYSAKMKRLTSAQVAPSYRMPVLHY